MLRLSSLLFYKRKAAKAYLPASKIIFVLSKSPVKGQRIILPRHFAFGSSQHSILDHHIKHSNLFIFQGNLNALFRFVCILTFYEFVLCVF